MRTANALKAARQVADEALYRASAENAHPLPPPPSATFMIWVNKGGNDATGTGSIEAPFLTIGHAMTFAAGLHPSSNQPVLILLGPGTYTENVSWVPWVLMTAFDQTSFAASIIGNVTLDSPLWVAYSATDSPIAGMDSLEVFGSLTLDFTGCVVNEGSFEIADCLAGIAMSVIGDPVGGGFLQLFNCLDVAVGSTLTVTGASLQTHSCNFLGDIHLVSTAAKAVQWESGADYFGSGGSPPNVFLNATAGQNVTAVLSASGAPASVTLTDGGGGHTSYSATADGIPKNITQVGGAAYPVRITGPNAIDTENTIGQVITSVAPGIAAWQSPPYGTPFVGTLTTTDNVPHTILTIPVPAGVTVNVTYELLGRTTAGGTPGDSQTLRAAAGFKNVGGVVTQLTTHAIGVYENQFDASMNSGVTGLVTSPISGTNLVFQITGVAGVTIDWKMIATVNSIG